MSVEQRLGGPGLVARVQAILLRPNAEWDAIDGEAATTRGLFVGYVCILAAIPALCALIGGQLFGYGAFFFHVRPSLAPAITQAVVSYGLAIVATFLLGFIINALAPSFDGQANSIQAMKVAAYAGTAQWVGGVFGLVPALGALTTLCALYGLFILYLGLPKLMKAPSEKALSYTIVTILCAIVMYLVIGAVAAAVAGPALWAGMMGGADHRSTVVTVDGQKIDADNLAKAATAAAASAKAMEAAQAAGKNTPATDPEKLKALLPDQIAGLPRTDLSSQSAGAGGVTTSNAEATYAKGDARITLTVTDMSAMGAFAGIAGAIGVESSKQTADGYEKIGKVDGRLTTEEWNRTAGSGKYSVIVASRFLVEAEGSAPSVDALKAAVAAVGPDRLEALAKG